MISYHDITAGLDDLGLSRITPVIVHIRTDKVGSVKGGLNTLMGALLACIDNVMMPVFTHDTLVIPESGPPDNFIQYGSGREANLKASIYTYDLPCSMPGCEASEALRRHPATYRSAHPVFSFTGLGLDSALAKHPPDDPYAPLRWMRGMDAWVLMMGAGPEENFSLHYAEHLVGRKQFIRWALSQEGIVEIPHFPGCPNGFHKMDYYLSDELRRTQVEGVEWQAVNLDVLLKSATALMQEDNFALLCNNLGCPRCNLVRKSIKEKYANHWQSEA